MTSKTTPKPAPRGSKPTAAPKTTRKTTAKSTAAKAKAAAKPVEPAANSIPAAPKPAPVVVTEKTPVTSAPDLKKQELLAEVVSKSGVAKRDAKPVVEAMLEIMGDALQDGRDLNLNPMGKIIIKKSKPVSNGTVLTTRVRLKQKLPQT
ncbi:HU family DNA-binding protein [Primorskyibacter aestuariivivens]|uniref:HU family DNA-binding protein n=1 Tax=Primorskyibacter aestuariivivens TaxID=1888912 RepID=UPI002300A213|nr:HU family DNA-binding protein [Primorskyibacter aestuariivivens]MDA7427589.1 HU family DNA-binding protein [Primorskyibacter aestuariivivens]